MRVLSLFSGIGGIDLGLERAGMTTVAQCEIDPFCNAVLAKHWPNVQRHNDVTTITGKWIYENCGRVDLIAAGFPCQDISNAGKRTGISGSRSGLYRHVVRCLRLVRPPKAILENVAALLGRGMGRVLGDLAAIGYDTEWDCVPASAVGALHHRDRVFITASLRTNPRRLRSQRVWTPTQGPWTWQQLEGLVQTEAQLSVPAGSIGGVADGVPGRVDRLRALGNAVVPQTIEVVGRWIMEQNTTNFG